MFVIDLVNGIIVISFVYYDINYVLSFSGIIVLVEVIFVIFIFSGLFIYNG